MHGMITQINPCDTKPSTHTYAAHEYWYLLRCRNTSYAWLTLVNDIPKQIGASKNKKYANEKERFLRHTVALVLPAANVKR